MSDQGLQEQRSATGQQAPPPSGEGLGEVYEEGAQGANDLRDRFPRWLRISIAVVAGATVLAAFAMLLFERKWFEPRARMADSYSRHAIGHRAFFEVLSRLKIKPLRYRKENRLGDLRAPVFLIMPQMSRFMTSKLKKLMRRLSNKQGPTEDLEGRLREAIRRRLRKGYDTVLVVPKWVVVFRKKQRLIESKLLELPALRQAMRDLLPDIQFPALQRLDSRGEHSWPWAVTEPHLAKEPSAGITTDVAFAQGLVLKRRSWKSWLGSRKRSLVSVFQDDAKGPGRLWVVADPDPLSNFRMPRADHTYLFYRLIREGLKTDTVVIDEGTHGHLQKLSLRDELSRFPNLLFSIHSCLLLLFVSWLGWVRFGKPLLPKEHPLRGPKEVLWITSRILADGKRSSALTSSYLLCMLEDLCVRLEFSKGSLIERCQKIDAWCAARDLPTEAVELYQRAMSLQARKRKSRGELMRDAQRIWKLRQEVLKTRWRVS